MQHKTSLSAGNLRNLKNYSAFTAIWWRANYVHPYVGVAKIRQPHTARPVSMLFQSCASTWRSGTPFQQHWATPQRAHPEMI